MLGTTALANVPAINGMSENLSISRCVTPSVAPVGRGGAKHFGGSPIETIVLVVEVEIFAGAHILFDYIGNTAYAGFERNLSLHRAAKCAHGSVDPARVYGQHS